MIFSSLRFAFRWNDHNAGQFNVYCGTGSITQVNPDLVIVPCEDGRRFFADYASTSNPSGELHASIYLARTALQSQGMGFGHVQGRKQRSVDLAGPYTFGLLRFPIHSQEVRAGIAHLFQIGRPSQHERSQLAKSRETH